jgi:hypothetical protein
MGMGGGIGFMVGGSFRAMMGAGEIMQCVPADTFPALASARRRCAAGFFRSLAPGFSALRWMRC